MLDAVIDQLPSLNRLTYRSLFLIHNKCHYASWLVYRLFCSRLWFLALHYFKLGFRVITFGFNKKQK